MELSPFFKSLIDQDLAPIVICDLKHIIIYMNPSAITRYKKYGGDGLVGHSLLNCHSEKSRELINKTLDWFNDSLGNNIIFESRNDFENKDVYIVALRDENKKLIGYYEKHEYRNIEMSLPYEFKSIKD